MTSPSSCARDNWPINAASAAAGRGAIEIGRLAEEAEANRWWIPEEIAFAPTSELVTRDNFTHRDLHRVLNDL
jgi:hypothetical protein